LQIKSSQEFLSQKYDLIRNYDDLLKSNEKQTEDLTQLSQNSAFLTKQASQEALKLDSIEQYGRRQNLEFNPLITGSTSGR